MKTVIHESNGVRVAEILAEGIFVNDTGDFLDLAANAGARHIVVRRENVNPDFFDLKTGLAGEILQKASNYGVAFGIVGDFDGERSSSLRDFIRESNRTGRHVFVPSLAAALEIFCAV